MKISKLKISIQIVFIVGLFVILDCFSIYTLTLGYADFLNYFVTDEAEKVIFNRGHYFGLGGVLAFSGMLLMGVQNIVDKKWGLRANAEKSKNRYFRITVAGLFIMILLPIIAGIYFSTRFSNDPRYHYCEEESDFGYRMRIDVYVKDMSLCGNENK